MATNGSRRLLGIDRPSCYDEVNSGSSGPHYFALTPEPPPSTKLDGRNSLKRLRINLSQDVIIAQWINLSSLTHK